MSLAAPLLAVAAFVLLGWGEEPEPSERALPVAEQSLEVWKVLIAAQVAAWTIFLGIGLRTLGELETLVAESMHGGIGSRTRRWRIQTARFLILVYGMLGLLLVLGGLAGIRNPPLLAGQDWKVPLLHVIAGAAASPFVIMLKRIQLYADDLELWSVTARDVERLQTLRRHLRSSTAALGIVVALAVVSTGALRTAVEAAGRTPLPEEFVIVYGAFLTAVVGAIYVHTFTAIERRGRAILQAAVPLPDPDPGEGDRFTKAAALRNQLMQELELGGDPRKNLEGLVAVFAPLVGALITGIGGLGG